MTTMQKIGFNAFWWEDLKTGEKIADCAQTLKKIGYRAVEFKLDSFDQDKDWGEEFQRAVRISEDEGLEVSNFVILRNLCAGQEDLREKAAEDVVKMVRAVAAAGVPMLNTVSGADKFTRLPDPGEWFRPVVEDFSAGWDNLVRSMDVIVRAAEREGVIVVLEPCCGSLVCNYGTTLEMFRRIDAPQLCLTFDPSHFFLYRDDIPAAVRALSDKIKHVHLKDAAGRPGEFGRDMLFPILGEGGIDIPSFLGALSDVGYEGFVSVEFEPFKYMNDVLKNDPARAAEISMESVKALLPE